MHMTLRRLAPLMLAAQAPMATQADIARALNAIDRRAKERGPSKLRRRTVRKVELGRNGAF
ncbi:MAG TPA: hypothetical protein VF485_10525 [Sphingomonas sp.]